MPTPELLWIGISTSEDWAPDDFVWISYNKQVFCLDLVQMFINFEDNKLIEIISFYLNTSIWTCFWRWIGISISPPDFCKKRRKNIF